MRLERESNQSGKWAYDEKARQLEAELARLSRRVTISLPEESVSGGEVEADNPTNNQASYPGQETSCFVNLHGNSNRCVSVGGDAMSEYGPCSAGGQPSTLPSELV